MTDSSAVSEKLKIFLKIRKKLFCFHTQKIKKSILSATIEKGEKYEFKNICRVNRIFLREVFEIH